MLIIGTTHHSMLATILEFDFPVLHIHGCALCLSTLTAHAQVIDEIVGDTLAAMPAARRAQPQAARAKAQEQEEEEDEGEMAELHQRLEAAKT